MWDRYVETEPDAPYEVLVPAERRRDYPGRIADILETLAVVESRRPRRVRVQLNPEHVDRTTDAWRHRLEVVLRGDLEPHGTGLRMRAVTAFAVRQE
ncbi:hypothetical protein ACFXAE_07715 [Streptomyces sp. NPDC059454]|uniref:hypothetical protein n=1 Tax=Streptomyces sp. NPDC059454 TaxID=3346836 RepID=UPI0036896BC7